MKLFLVLLKKELKTQIFSGAGNVKKDAVGAIISLVVSALFLSVFVMLFVMLQRNFAVLGLSSELAIVFITAALAVQTLLSLGLFAGVMFGRNDFRVILPLPVPPRSVISAKVAALYLKEVVNSCFYLLPVFVAYGVMSGASVWYYVVAALLLLLAAMMVSAAAMLLAPLYLKIKELLLKKPLVLLIGSLVLIAAVLVVYNRLLGVISELIFGNNLKFLFNTKNAAAITEFSKFCVPARQFAAVLTGESTFVPLIIIVAIIVVLGGLADYVNGLVYYRFIRSDGESKVGATTATHNRRRGKFGALLFKEFNEVFRSPSYLFSYVSVALSLPMLCYLTMGVLSEMISKAVGTEYVAPFAVLILVLYSTVSNTFAGDVISREENRLMIVKTIPVGYVKQMNAKFVLALTVALVSDALTVFMLTALGVLTVESAPVLFAITFLATASGIMHLISKDIDNPSSFREGEIESGANKNISSSIIRSFLLSTVLGAIALALAIFRPALMYICVLTLVLADFLYALLCLYSFLGRRIRRLKV